MSITYQERRANRNLSQRNQIHHWPLHLHPFPTHWHSCASSSRRPTPPYIVIYSTQGQQVPNTHTNTHTRFHINSHYPDSTRPPPTHTPSPKTCNNGDDTPLYTCTPDLPKSMMVYTSVPLSVVVWMPFWPPRVNKGVHVPNTHTLLQLAPSTSTHSYTKHATPLGVNNGDSTPLFNTAHLPGSIMVFTSGTLSVAVHSIVIHPVEPVRQQWYAPPPHFLTIDLPESMIVCTSVPLSVAVWIPFWPCTVSSSVQNSLLVVGS